MPVSVPYLEISQAEALTDESSKPGASNPATLAEWLAYCEQLHPLAIDMGLDRVQSVANKMGLAFQCPVITVAGTNGKGSTCAMLEAILLQAGFRCGVYSSPHLVDFQERCRIDGEQVEAASLVPCFASVEKARCPLPSGVDEAVTLTYFEFSTLAILQRLVEAQLDVVVLEVGLGGRLDAVNIVDTDCAIITSIDLDHMEFLGPDRESIGREKAGIMRPGKPVIVSDPVPPLSLSVHAAALGADLWQLGRDFTFSGDRQQWGWAASAARGGKRQAGLAYPALRGANQLANAAGVIAALNALRDQLPVTAQAVRAGLGLTTLAGRFQIVPGTPVLVLDVAHNPHAVAALAENIDAMGYYPQTLAVFGAMADKNIQAMLLRMLPLVDRWYFTDLPTPRAATAAGLMAHWQALPGKPANAQAAVFSSVGEALTTASSHANPTDRIVVFGSFYTVGGLLKKGLPRLAAPHLAAEHEGKTSIGLG